MLNRNALTDQEAAILGLRKTLSRRKVAVHFKVPVSQVIRAESKQWQINYGMELIAKTPGSLDGLSRVGGDHPRSGALV
jgi:hypothetical protein